MIENGTGPVATVKPMIDASLSATIARLRKRSDAYVDEGFAEAVQAGIDAHREPFDTSILE